MNENNFNLNKTQSDYFDWVTFLIAVLLVAIGLISIYSATYNSNMSSYFYKQVFSAGVGFTALFIVMYIPESWLKFNSYTIYGVSSLLLLIVDLVGTTSHGTKGWIRLGGMSLQPAELAKLGVLLVVSNFLSNKGVDIRTLRDLGRSWIWALLPIGLILLQPDFGSATVIGALMLGIMFWAGFDAFILFFVLALPVIILLSLKGVILAVMAVVIFSSTALGMRRNLFLTASAVLVFIGIGIAAPLIYDNVIHSNLMDHQKARIETFVNPEANPRGAGYNVIQSVMAVGSGGAAGKGFLQGTQTQLRYIPMQWTDFIFSVPTEEFGFIGGVLVVLLHAGLIIRAIKVASLVNSKFLSIACVGAATVFLYHWVINVGMAMGIMPVMGIPLPFMSYGGTSILINLAMVGIIMHSYRNYKKRSA